MVKKLSLLIAMTLGVTIAQAQQPGRGPIDMESQTHIDAAMAIAKQDLLKEAKSLCPALPQASGFAPVGASARGSAPAGASAREVVVEPTKVFDNVYYVGFNDIGAWAITTSEGIIMIDSLISPEAAKDVLVPGLKKLGLDPSKIKYVVVTHGHFDHFGGTKYLQETYGARILISATDWDIMEKGDPNPTSPPRQKSTPRPKRDMEIVDGQKLTLGDTTITMVSTPGHTQGITSILLMFKGHGIPMVAILWGGGNMTQSLPSLEHFVNHAKKVKPAARLSSHPGADGLANMEQIRKNPDGPNPFVYGEERFGRYLDIAVECAKATSSNTKGK
jgi:metallo-beta-lactamase class B